ncbi:MAG: transporter substrate-binding domain-containing protein, partial [Ruminiclostridium sp.]|nr:transporter substrate-binding domain-containing protein [Ruminiclostridium sp.]
MKNKTRKIDFIIIAVMLLIVAAAAVFFVLPHQEDESAPASGTRGELSYKDYNGRTIGVGTGSMFDEIVNDKLPDANIMYYNTYADMMTAVSVGKLDAACLDEPIARYIMNEYSGVTYIKEPLDSYEYGFSFAKNENGRALCDKFSAFLRKIKADHTLDEL